MQNNLKLYHKLLPLLIIPICLFLFVSYGWSSYATNTERSGLNGDMFIYYNLTSLQYSLYTGCISLVGICFIFLLLFYLIKSNSIILTKLYWYFLIFIGLVVVCEILLQLRFTGKG